MGWEEKDFESCTGEFSEERASGTVRSWPPMTSNQVLSEKTIRGVIRYLKVSYKVKSTFIPYLY